MMRKEREKRKRNSVDISFDGKLQKTLVCHVPVASCNKISFVLRHLLTFVIHSLRFYLLQTAICFDKFENSTIVCIQLSVKTLVAGDHVFLFFFCCQKSYHSIIDMSINSPSIEILVQPASNKLRFRYESERPSSAMEGVGSTKENKKYPAIRVIGYTGNATITVSLVTHTEPYGYVIRNTSFCKYFSEKNRSFSDRILNTKSFQKKMAKERCAWWMVNC